MRLPSQIRCAIAACLVLLWLCASVAADETHYVVATFDGQRVRVKDNRQPALYTADYGDCLGESTFNVTRFDAAYYKDNMTIIFHLAGETGLQEEAIMMNIGVVAYGESRFDLTFNPCNANIGSACPAKAGVPIEAAGIIPINQDDVSGIPELALSIPDFEGQAILRIFSNSTQAEIGCFAAQITNGNTFRQREAVSSVLGAFTLLTIVSSFATTIYGDDVLVMRKHYAHSLSVSIVFAVWHHIFYSGALSMNWPSILVAFWSNYSWAGGMIYSESMQNTINNFIGSNKGNTSHVGAAGTGVKNPNLGGGYDIQQIYKRALQSKALTQRHLVDASNGFTYYGQPVRPGLPLPGNYSGFAGTLAMERIPASNAFLTGLLWYLVLFACILVSLATLKLLLEGLGRLSLISGDRLALFRTHYLHYIAVTLMRTLLIGFFVMAFLTMFQFSYLHVAGPVAVACIVFICLVVGLGSVAAFAWCSRIKLSKNFFEVDRLNVEHTKILRWVPWYSISRESKSPRSEDKVYATSIPWRSFKPVIEAQPIHADEDFVRRFGWLASRYRSSKWWFFTVWIFYEFLRASFLAGASGSPSFQVFGLLGIEVVAFFGLVLLRPFEGQRLNVILAYLLGFSKVSTTALSAVFDPRYGISRIPATAIGIGIIGIQSLLTIAVLCASFVGAITSYMSVVRNRTKMRPKRWIPIREKYFKRMDVREQDLQALRPASVQEPNAPPTPYFSVKQVRRLAKLEDEDIVFMQEAYQDYSASRLTLSGHSAGNTEDENIRRHRSGSLQSQTSHTSMPRAARLHRASWRMRSYSDLQGTERPGPGGESSMKTPTIDRAVRAASPYDRVERRLTPTSWENSRVELIPRISEESLTTSGQGRTTVELPSSSGQRMAAKIA